MDFQDEFEKLVAVHQISKERFDEIIKTMHSQTDGMVLVRFLRYVFARSLELDAHYDDIMGSLKEDWNQRVAERGFNDPLLLSLTEREAMLEQLEGAATEYRNIIAAKAMIEKLTEVCAKNGVPPEIAAIGARWREEGVKEITRLTEMIALLNSLH